MNKRIAAFGLLATLALSGCGLMEPDAGNNILKLPECSGRDTVFATLNIDSAVDVYHSTVSRVIDAHVNDVADINGQALECTANEYRGLVEPTEELRSLAQQLPEWGPTRDLSEADLGPVLLEYLRTYECALLHRGQFLSVYILREDGDQTTAVDGSIGQTMNRANLTEEQLRQQTLIDHEIKTARPTLERTLAYLGGIDRLQPLTAELECLKRASLDLRNAMGLIAESASCMPKIWDARGSLRDLPE